ncbi:hypothetical protein GOP47_0019854 [Adiantum capillus-veneris]|uniref:Uncharacterized protein n=1 Tax=Adiantum capillus-veneris TaxID=13818 RepID=A0A9D4UDA4_ADICA|nr:hypothetical protein GOP47_0019854 [Adiantum capillus-veneris]
MPVSWEMASGPTVAYKMAGQGSTCVAVEGPKGASFSNFRVQDGISRGLCASGEVSKGSNYRFSSSHDTVVRGLSALSLRGQCQSDPESTVKDSQSGSLGALCGVPLESYRCMSSEESLQFVDTSSVSGQPLGLGRPHCNVDLLQCNELQIQTSSSEETESGSISQLESPKRTACNTAYYNSVVNANPCGNQGLLEVFSYNTLKSANESESLLRMDGFDLDTISESSFSLETVLPVSSSSSGEASPACDDAEVESPFKDGVDLSCPVGSSTSPRKGLSRFYAGKSRSFICLRDIVSVKDLAKPEGPYAKKRKVHSSSSQLPHLQKGSTTISKKPLQSGKSTLALAVAMSTKNENEAQFSYARPMGQQSLVPSRSYSLSDLQHVSGSLFFIG